MNRIIEIHDSVLSRVTSTDTQTDVMFSPAYIHESDGKPGIDPGTGWTQDAILRFVGAHITESPSELPLSILDGHLVISGVTHQNSIPVPLDVNTEVELLLLGPNDQSLRVQAQQVTLEMIGQPEYVEEFE